MNRHHTEKRWKLRFDDIGRGLKIRQSLKSEDPFAKFAQRGLVVSCTLPSVREGAPLLYARY